MARIELTNLRSQKVKHFWDDVLQKRVAEFTLHDQHYLDEGGNWQDCVEAWESDGADGFDSGMAKLRHRVRLAWLTGVFRYHPVRGAPLKFVTVSRPERKGIGQQWPALILGTRSQEANWMHFDTAITGYDVLSTWRQVECLYRLKEDNNAYKRLRWQLTFNNLIFDWATREVRDGATAVSHLEPIIAWDANGAPVAVTESWDGTYYEIIIDTTGAVFPVTVDPTFTAGQGSNETLDTYLKASAPTTNYGSADNWRVDLGDNHVGIMSWDLSSLAGATCTSATQTMYRYNNAGSSDLAWSLWQLAAANEDWTEAGATWNTKDGTNAWAGSVGCATATTDYISPAIGTLTIPGASGGGVLGTPSTGGVLDTATVEAAFGGTLHLRVTGGSERNTCTAEHATAGYRPKLVVEYTTGAVNAELTAALCTATAGSPNAAMTASSAMAAALCTATAGSPNATIFDVEFLNAALCTATAAALNAAMTASSTLAAQVATATAKAFNAIMRGSVSNVAPYLLLLFKKARNR